MKEICIIPSKGFDCKKFKNEVKNDWFTLLRENTPNKSPK